MSEPPLFLCAGAVKTAVEALVGEPGSWPGAPPTIVFDTVGALRDRALAGERADAIVLSDAAMGALVERGLVDPASIRPLGVTGVGLARRDGVLAPSIADAAGLRAALLEARSLGIADPGRGATAGRHIVTVFAALGIAEAMPGKTRVYPFGVDAVAGCGRGEVDLAVSQATEIIGRPGVALHGLLPPPHDLRTGYAIAPLIGSPSGAAIVEALRTPRARLALASIGFA